MKQISENFTLGECNVSDKHPEMIGTIPTTAQKRIESLVKNLLQPICDATGWHDHINSGYRNYKLNEAVGGATTSQHTLGEAADNVFLQNGNPVPTIEVMKVVIRENLSFDQMIAYPTFVHLSYKDKIRNRKQILYNKSYTGKRL